MRQIQIKSIFVTSAKYICCVESERNLIPQVGLSKDCLSESVQELFLEEGIDIQDHGREEAVVCWQAGRCSLGRRQR